MTIDNQDVGVYSGDSFEVIIDVTEDGSARDLSGSSVEWAISDKPGSAEVLDQSDTGVDASITDAGNGEVTITVDEGVTDDLRKSYSHELRVTDSSGRKSVVTRGLLTILPRVNQ